jgi:hypothetical protein
MLLKGKSRGKRPLGKPRHKWVDNIKMDPEPELIGLAQDRDQWRTLVNAVMKMNRWVA